MASPSTPKDTPGPARVAMDRLRAENESLRAQLAACRAPEPPSRPVDFEICADRKGAGTSEPVKRIGAGWIHPATGGMSFVRLAFEPEITHILTSGRYVLTLWPVSGAPLPNAPVSVAPSEVSAPVAAPRHDRKGAKAVPMAVLSARAGVTASTLRGYVGAGLVPEAGPEGYGPIAQERADLIRTLRSTLPPGAPLRQPLIRALEARGWSRHLPAGS